MDKWKEYRAKLERNISQLTPISNLEFVLDICQRLLPEYEKFVLKHNWGDYQLLIESFDYCIKHSKLENLDNSEINKLIIQIDRVTPDTEYFGDSEASFALNASVAISETLKFMLDKADEHISNIASYMYDTIDFQVQDKFENLTTEEIDNHPMLIDEMNRQIEKTTIVA